MTSSKVVKLNNPSTTNLTTDKSKVGNNDSIISDPIYQGIVKVTNAFEKISLAKNVTTTKYPDRIQKDINMTESSEISEHLNSEDNPQTTFKEILDSVDELHKLYQHLLDEKIPNWNRLSPNSRVFRNHVMFDLLNNKSNVCIFCFNTKHIQSVLIKTGSEPGYFELETSAVKYKNWTIDFKPTARCHHALFVKN